nr:hypothetical protein [Defluviitalea phaphyphila]
MELCINVSKIISKIKENTVDTYLKFCLLFGLIIGRRGDGFGEFKKINNILIPPIIKEIKKFGIKIWGSIITVIRKKIKDTKKQTEGLLKCKPPEKGRINIKTQNENKNNLK